MFASGPNCPLPDRIRRPRQTAQAVVGGRSANGAESHAGRSREDGPREQPRPAGRSARATDRDFRRRPGEGAYAVNLESLTTTRERDVAARPTSSPAATRCCPPTASAPTPASASSCRGAADATRSGLDAARATTSNPTGRFNPQLDSSLAASYTQPLLRNFKIDAFRQNVAVSLKKRRRLQTCSFGSR